MGELYFQYRNNFIKYQDIESKLIYGNPNRKDTTFTIAIPTYNRHKLLENALTSALVQKGVDDYEIVIVDNSNSSLTEEVIKNNLDNRVYYYRNDKNIGMFGNWNRCIELAKGKYIIILNDDDWLSEDFLLNCIEHLKPEVDGLYFPSHTVDYRKDINKEKKKNYNGLKKILNIMARKTKKLHLFDFLLGNQSAGTLGVLMKTEYLKTLGGYTEEYFPSSDYVMHANYCYNYNVYRINKVMNYYRKEENESAKQETLKKWEEIDNDIREYFIEVISKRKRFLKFLNLLIQENRVEGLVVGWNYQTNSKRRYNILRNMLKKVVILKYFLNI